MTHTEQGNVAHFLSIFSNLWLLKLTLPDPFRLFSLKKFYLGCLKSCSCIAPVPHEFNPNERCMTKAKLKKTLDTSQGNAWWASDAFTYQLGNIGKKGMAWLCSWKQCMQQKMYELEKRNQRYIWMGLGQAKSQLCYRWPTKKAVWHIFYPSFLSFDCLKWPSTTLFVSILEGILSGWIWEYAWKN